MTQTSRPDAPTAPERQRDAERTRQEILDVAIREFARNGYSGARVDEIAARTRTANVDTDDVDDASLTGAKMGPGGAAESHRAEELQAESIVPVDVRQREEIAAPGGAGVVDHEIEPAKVADGGLHDGLGCARLPQINRLHQTPRRERGRRSSSWSRDLAATTSCMPSAPRVSAMARPMPRLAPVTIATLSDSWRSIHRALSSCL